MQCLWCVNEKMSDMRVIDKKDVEVGCYGEKKQEWCVGESRYRILKKRELQTVFNTPAKCQKTTIYRHVKILKNAVFKPFLNPNPGNLTQFLTVLTYNCPQGKGTKKN